MINDNIRFDGKEMYRLAYAICQEFLYVLPRASVPGFAIKRTFALIYHLQFRIPGYANETRVARQNKRHTKRNSPALGPSFFFGFLFLFRFFNNFATHIAGDINYFHSFDNSNRRIVEPTITINCETKQNRTFALLFN